MRVLIKVIDPPGIEGRRSPLDSVDDVALLEEEFGQISAILTSDARDQSNASCHEPVIPIPCQERGRFDIKHSTQLIHHFNQKGSSADILPEPTLRPGQTMIRADG